MPSEWPFKEELLREVQANADMKEMMRERRKRSREDERSNRLTAAEDEGDGSSEEEMEVIEDENEYEHMMRRIPSHNDDDDKFNEIDVEKTNPSSSNIKGDGSMRAFYKEFTRVVEYSDVVIIVLDARDPQGTRCAEVEQFIRKSGTEKRIILLLNKIDLVPKSIVLQWLKVLRMELPAVAFKSSSDKAMNNGTSDCLGSETLLSLLKNYARNKKMKVAITVGIVGLPNVGKSSLINSLKRTRAVNVGGTPGITRAIQEVSLDKHVKLLDSPGIVFKGVASGLGSSKDHDIQATLRNAVKVEKVADPIAVATEIVRKCDAVHLQRIYKIQQYKYGADTPLTAADRQQLTIAEQAERFLYLVATTYGLLRRGGVPDIVAAARMILNDWNSGKIPYYTVPPERTEHLLDDAKIMQTWGPEFDLGEAIKSEKSLVIDALEEKKLTGLQKIDAGAMVKSPILNAEDDDVPKLVPVDRIQSMDIVDEPRSPSNDIKQPMKMKADPSTLKNRAEASQKSLYSNEGQFNPHQARQEKRKKKKLKKLRNVSKGDESDDYDWGIYDKME